MATANVQIRMDADLKKETEAALKSMGLTMSSAINMFCHQIINQRRIPFEIVMPSPHSEIPNKETRKAMDDVLKGKNLSRTYDSIDEMWEDLNA